MQKLERLLNLTAVLLHSSRPLAASELRDRVPGYPEADSAFHRAFERDKDDLREMGVPLQLSEIPGADPPLEGYRIPRDRYYLPDPGLDPDELAALQLAASAVRLDGVEGMEALWTLGGAAPGAAVAEVAAIPTHPHLGPLFDAVSRRAPVTFRYRDAEREVHPYRIGFERGHWYLRGYDMVRDAVRVYRIDRIEGTVTIGAPGSVEVPPEESEDPTLVRDGWAIGQDPPVRCRLLVDASHAALALGHLDEAEVVETRPDGAVVLELMVVNRDAFVGLVLTYLDHAEILEPAEMREQLVAWLREVPT